MIRSLVVLFALTVATPVFAQDKEVEDWSGVYISVTASGDSEQVTTSSTDSVNQITNLVVPGRGLVVVPGTSRAVSASDSKTVFGGGAALGWQGQSKSFVYGLEVSGTIGQSSTATSTTASLPPTILVPASSFTAARSVKSDYDWSARLRLGFATGKALIYATGGVAGTRARLTATDTYTDPGGPGAACSPTPCTTANFGPYGPAVSTSSAKRSLIGWTAGAGIDYKLGKQISIGLEYRHSDFGSKTFGLATAAPVNGGVTFTDGNGNSPPTTTGAIPGNTRVGLRSDRLSARLSFHF